MPGSPCRAPVVTATTPTSPTAALLTANPPSLGGPFSSYTFTATPAGGGPSVTVTCDSPTICPMAGLKPYVLYDVTVSAKTTSGATTPPSAPMPLEMPGPGAPALTSADATGPTQGTAIATPPKTGGPWTSYTFTATPIGGGPPVTVISDSPTADFMGLMPGTLYLVDVVATGSNGNSPASNTLSFSTPSFK